MGYTQIIQRFKGWRGVTHRIDEVALLISEVRRAPAVDGSSNVLPGGHQQG